MAHAISYLIPSGLVFQREKEKRRSTGKVHFSETQTVSQRCPTPDNGNHAAGTNCLDLPTQKRVASPSATAPARTGDNGKREISAKNRQKSNSFRNSVLCLVFFFKCVPSNFIICVKSAQFTRETTQNIALK